MLYIIKALLVLSSNFVVFPVGFWYCTTLSGLCGELEIFYSDAIIVYNSQKIEITQRSVNW